MQANDAIERVSAAVERARSLVPGGLRAYAYMRIRAAGRESEILVGDVNQPSPEVSVIDWHSAPLAEAFFSNAAGDDYEIESGGRIITGTLLERTLISLEQGQLKEVTLPEGTFRQDGGGQWRRVDRDWPAIPLRPPSARRPFRSPLDVELDPAQRRVVDLPSDRSVLILGEAGFGKTTVALHRLVELRRKKGRGFRGAVIVPTEGLRRLTEIMLERRDMEGIDVWTFDRWAAHVARRAFADLPKRESAAATGGTVRLKRHRALRDVLTAFVRDRPSPTVDPERPSRSRALARRADLEHLFGDRKWMDEVVARANGAIATRAAGETTEHTKIQFLDPAEIQFAHVDRSSLQAVDGRSLDEGTPFEDANSVDIEDYAVLFELERLRAVSRGETPLAAAQYDCVVVDEAQELASLELAMIGRAIKSNGSLIVAGDAQQQVDPTSDFGGWETTMQELAQRDYERAVLQVNYRCPPEVTALARGVLDPNTGSLEPVAAIPRVTFSSTAHLVLWLIDALRTLQSGDPTASIAVIARTPAVARALERTLRHAISARLALNGDFVFRPGILVTAVPDVKGLEFDYVLLPDVDVRTYPGTQESRRSLYVALTRATHQLALAAVQEVSPLVVKAQPS